MVIISNLIARLTMDATAFDRNAQRSRQSVRGMMGDAALASRQFTSMTAALVGIGTAVGAIYAAKRALGSSLREATSFEYGLARVNTMLDDSSARYLPRFRAEIERMSTQYGEAVGILTAGAYDILSASIAPAEAMKVLEVNLQAAKGGFTDTATAVRASVGILNAYAMSADRIGDVTNLMHKIVKRGVITFEELAQNIGTVTSLAAVLDVDLEAVGATIATMTRAGINAEIAMTALRSILNTFKNPSDEAREAAAELGFTLDETSIRGRGLITIMERLRNANAAQLEALMPNVRGLVGFAAALKSATKLGDDYAYMLSDVQAALDALTKQQATTQAEMDKTREAWNRAKRSLGEELMPSAVDFMNGLRTALTPVAGLLEAIGDAAEKTAEILKRETTSLREIAGAMRAGVSLPPAMGGQLGPRPRMNLGDNTAVPLDLRPEMQLSPAAEEWDRQMVETIRQIQENNRIEALRRAARAPEFQGHGMGTDGASVVEEARRTRESTVDIAAAYRAMYEDIDQQTEASFTARRGLLRQEYEQYDEALRRQTKSHADYVKAKADLDEWYRQKQHQLETEQARAGNDWLAGARAAIEDLQRELGGLGELGYDTARRGIEGIGDALADAALNGRDLGDALKEVGRSIAAAGIKWGTTQLLTTIFGSARGNVFDRQGIMAFARGDVFNSPTLFPFARGLGLMGEAGPEAVLPLDRDPQGRLGVRAGSGGGGRGNDALLARMVGLLEVIAKKQQEVTVYPVMAPGALEAANEKWARSRTGRRAIVHAYDSGE